MLAGNDGADGEVEVTADATSPAPHDDPDRKGTDFLHTDIKVQVKLKAEWTLLLTCLCISFPTAR